MLNYVGSIRKQIRLLISRVVDLFLRNKNYAPVELFFSIAASLFAREKVKVVFDGQDWLHMWSSGSFFHGSPVFFPERQLNSNLHFFTCHYSPKDGDIVVDVGAGAGTEIPFFSRAVGKKGRIYAVESDSTAFRRMKKMVDLEGYTNTVLINLALSSKPGYGQMISDSAGSIGGQLRILDDKAQNEFLIQVDTLNRITLNYSITRIDFLKVNVEGHELEVLAGLEEGTVSIHNICISCHDFLGPPIKPTFAEVRDLLKRKGFFVKSNPYENQTNFAAYYVYASSSLNKE